MLTGSEARNFSSCFVSAPAGIDLGFLPEVLSEHRINWEWAKANLSELANPYSAIRDADFFMGILNGTRADYRVMHETGAAAALSKPVLLILSSLRKLPVDLRWFTVAHVKLTDDRALRFHIDAFLSAPKRSAFEHHQQVSSLIPKPPSFSAGERSNLFSMESWLEREVYELIVQAGGSAILEPAGEVSERYRPDLLVWLGSQEPELLDPAVIEIKRQVERSKIHLIEDRLLSFMGSSGVRTGMVITIEPVPERAKPRWPNVFWLDLLTFRELLLSSRLGQYLRESRNRSIHGVR
jgi:hypothetical protein